MKRKLLKYIVIGGLAALLDLFLLWMFTDLFHIYYIYGAVLAFIFSLGFGFILQKYVTFQDTSKKHVSQLVRFTFFQLIGLALYIALLWGGVDKLGFFYIYVAVFAKGIVFVWNFIMNNYFNFNA